MIKCPSCFQVLPQDRFQWICNSGRCPTQSDETASRSLGVSISLPPVTGMLTAPANSRNWKPPPMACMACKGEAIPCCPNCHFGLPDGWYSGDAMCVALAGARYTGKSVYIGVVVHFLQDLVERIFNSTLILATSQTTRIYRSVYEQVLFEQTGVLPATPSSETSQTYQIQPLVLGLGTINGKARYLAIRDVAGEDLEKENRRSLGFFRHADLVAFLFDPLAVPTIQNHLKGLIPAQDQGSTANPIDVLTTVQQLMGSTNGRLAVVLSKFDALQELRRFPEHQLGQVMGNPGAAINRHPAHLGDSSDRDLVHEEVRGILQLLGAGNIVASVENWSRATRGDHRFMAVSSLGASADGGRLAETGIAPFRCLDPLLWLFLDHHLLEA